MRGGRPAGMSFGGSIAHGMDEPEHPTHMEDEHVGANYQSLAWDLADG